jgi:hypothetical protein
VSWGVLGSLIHWDLGGYGDNFLAHDRLCLSATREVGAEKGFVFWFLLVQKKEWKKYA